jgi:hypothetical protein
MVVIATRDYLNSNMNLLKLNKNLLNFYLKTDFSSHKTNTVPIVLGTLQIIGCLTWLAATSLDSQSISIIAE